MPSIKKIQLPSSSIPSPQKGCTKALHLIHWCELEAEIFRVQTLHGIKTRSAAYEVEQLAGVSERGWESVSSISDNIEQLSFRSFTSDPRSFAAESSHKVSVLQTSIY